jgi:RIO kinase 1
MPKPDDVAYPRSKERFEDRRKERTQRKLEGEFFDHATLLSISRLINQGQFDAIEFPVSTGKEGGVFRASSGTSFRAVKVYRISNAIFRRLPAYTIDELRKDSSARNFAGLVYAWTRREHTILRRMYEHAVRVPQPYGYLRNVLVMDFVGTDGLPAPRLKDAVVEAPSALYEDLVVQLRHMIVDAKLVHADLSPYNVLYSEGQPVLIDVAQSIPKEHPQAAELLKRDIDNFAKYFGRLELTVDADEFYTAVGGDSVGPPTEK